MFSLVVIAILCLSIQNAHANECHCSATGDPHYSTFDGVKFDFMGKCKYILSETIEQGMECSYTVNAINVDRGHPHVSFTNVLEIRFMDHVFRFEQGNRLVVDGQEVRSRAVTEGENVQVMLAGNWLTLVSPKCGLRVEFDGLWNALVKLKRNSYAGKVRGLCGDCDGNAGNDFMARGTKSIVNALQFAQSFITHDEGARRPECVVGRVPLVQPHPCRGPWERRARELKYCGAFLAETNSPFQQCIRQGRVNVDGLYQACRYDVCVNKENLQKVNEIVCESLSNFAIACSEQGFNGIDWRTKCGCEMKCPGLKVYMPRVEPCPTSCDSGRKDAVCPKGLPVKEGCACPPGLVLFGADCVTADKCPPNKEVSLTFKRLKKKSFEENVTFDQAWDKGDAEEATFGESGNPLSVKKSKTNKGHNKGSRSKKGEDIDLTEAKYEGNGDFFGGASDFMKNFNKK